MKTTKATWLVGAWWMQSISSASELLWNVVQLVTEFSGQPRGPLVDLLEGHLAIHAGLAHAEQVQVGPVQEQDVRHGSARSRRRGRAV